MDLPTYQGQQTLYYIEVSFLSPIFFEPLYLDLTGSSYKEISLAIRKTHLVMGEAHIKQKYDVQ